MSRTMEHFAANSTKLSYFVSGFPVEIFLKNNMLSEILILIRASCHVGQGGNEDFLGTVLPELGSS